MVSMDGAADWRSVKAKVCKEGTFFFIAQPFNIQTAMSVHTRPFPGF